MALSGFGTAKSEFQKQQFEGITGALQKLGQEFVNRVVGNLDKDGSNASYQLRQSTDFDVQVFGSVYTLRILFRDVKGEETKYWEYVNYNTRPRVGGRVSGKPTLREALKRWIFQKGIDIATMFPNNKKKPLSIDKLKERNSNSLAYLISRRMRRSGRIGTKFLTREIPYFQSQLTKVMTQELKRNVIIEIQQL
jgi:hypothetical protein